MGVVSETPAASSRISQLGGGVPAPLLLVAAMLSFQLGAAVATGLFARVGIPATAFLRNLVGGLLLLAIGVELALMNVVFYEAIKRIPLGVAVTVEFVGPLSVALLQSRRLRDVIWAVLAATGIALFAGTPTSAGINTAGLLFALLAGAAWACYIFTAQRVGRSWQGSQGLAAGMFVSALLLAPEGLGRVGSVTPGSGLTIVALGILSAALPFGLEMAALRRLTARAYGVLASLEPAIATVVGVAALGQQVRATEVVATLLVVTASVGTTVEGD
jgi:inner membrane transporter RhtA